MCECILWHISCGPFASILKPKIVAFENWNDSAICFNLFDPEKKISKSFDYIAKFVTKVLEFEWFYIAIDIINIPLGITNNSLIGLTFDFIDNIWYIYRKCSKCVFHYRMFASIINRRPNPNITDIFALKNRMQVI